MIGKSLGVVRFGWSWQIDGSKEAGMAAPRWAPRVIHTYRDRWNRRTGILLRLGPGMPSCLAGDGLTGPETLSRQQMLLAANDVPYLSAECT